jgi:glycosyltransferase involved in cell wall biosynthesis
MHICHVITRLIIGGAQENTILTCEGLHQRGHRVTLIAGPTTGPEGSLVARARAGGYDYLELRELIRPVNPWMDARSKRYLQMTFDRIRPDIVHTHSSKAGILARHAAHHCRVPHIVHTIHGMSFNRTQPGWLQRAYAWLERRAARRTDRIVTVADAMIDQSVAAGVARRDKFVTIRSGMEVGHFTPRPADRAAARSAWGVPADAVVVGTVARLFQRKGYEQLIPIMAAAAAQDPRLHFVWIGDGQHRPTYEAQLAELGLADRTTLTGLVPPDQVPQLLVGCDIVAHTSQWEGLPRAVVQALLLQVPVVAFDIDGTPEVVFDHQTGRLAPLNNLPAFTQALCDLAADADLRRQYGQAGRTHCLEAFSADKMVEDLERLYLQLTTE